MASEAAQACRAACVSHTFFFSSPSGWHQPWLSPSAHLPAGASQEAYSALNFSGASSALPGPLPRSLLGSSEAPDTAPGRAVPSHPHSVPV